MGFVGFYIFWEIYFNNPKSLIFRKKKCNSIFGFDIWENSIYTIWRELLCNFLKGILLFLEDYFYITPYSYFNNKFLPKSFFLSLGFKSKDSGFQKLQNLEFKNI